MSASTRLLGIMARLYRAGLLLYPRSFRRTYGDAMTQAFRDHCRDATRQRGVWGLLGMCGSELFDLAVTAIRVYGDETRARSRRNTRSIVVDMKRGTYPHAISPRLWIALVTTALAFVVTLVASLNLYLLEDSSPLTPAAYDASPLLRFSFDGIYLSALVAGVVICAVVGYAITSAERSIAVGLAVAAILVMIGGFGGLVYRHPATFLLFAVVFVCLVLASLAMGRIVAARTQAHLGHRPAALLGACISTGVALLVNLIALVPHTLALNPVSHSLYMHGEIGATHLNSLLIALSSEVVAIVVCMGSVGAALRGALRDGSDGTSVAV